VSAKTAKGQNRLLEKEAKNDGVLFENEFRKKMKKNDMQKTLRTAAKKKITITTGNGLLHKVMECCSKMRFAKKQKK